MKADKADREKARREIHKNAMSHIEKIMEATFDNSSCTDTYIPSLKPSK